MWTYEERQIFTWQMCACTWEKMCCWGGRKVPTASRKLSNHHSSSDTLTLSHSVQKWRHIHGDTNSLSAWLLTSLRWSEVNSLNRLNKPVQLAVVNPQLKNRIFAKIASFSCIVAAVGSRKMKVFIAAPVNRFKWSQLQPLKKNIWISGLQNDSPQLYDSNLKQIEVGGCEAAAHWPCISVSEAGAAAPTPLMIKKMKRLHISTWWLMQMRVLSRYVTVAASYLVCVSCFLLLESTRSCKQGAFL